MRLRGALFLLLAQTSFAGPVEDADFSVIDRLRERERENLKQVVKSQAKKYSRVERAALKVQIADIIASPSFPAHVSRGARLIDLKTGDENFLTEDIYVQAKSLADKDGFIYLQKKDGELAYKTLAQNAANIKEVARMHEPPLYYSPVEKKTVKRYDEDFSFFTELNFQLGYNSGGFTKDLVNDRTAGGALAYRYEARAYSSFRLPFHIGAGVMFESSNKDLGSGESYSARSVSFGPLLKTPSFMWGKHKLAASAGIRTSLSSRVEENRAAQSGRYNLSQSSLFLGLQKELELPIGAFLMGINIQRQWSRASSGGLSADVDPESAYDDSIAFSFGHKTRWP